MRCSSARKLISDYIDDNLDARESLHLKQHLQGCPDCQQLLKDFQKIVKSSQELEELSPSEETWLKIKAKLKTEEQKILLFQPRKRGWFSFLFSQPKLKYAFSSALVLAFIFGAVILGLRQWKGREALGGDEMQKYTLAKVDEAEHHYQLAIKALMEAASSQKGSIDPYIAQAFQENIEIINSTITACQQAVFQEPDNIETRNYLLAAYMEKVDLLNEMMNIKKKSTPKRGLGTTI